MFRRFIAAMAIAVIASGAAHAADSLYKVQKGDTLSSIAQKHYGNASRWTVIYQVNRGKIRGGGAIIIEGTELLIPDLTTGVTTTAGVTAPAGAETLFVATGNQYPPFSDRNLPAGGMATEIVQTAMVRLGYDAKFDFLPWSDGYDRTRDGRYAATVPYAFTPERARDYFYSEPIYEQLMLAFFRSDKPYDIETVDDLDGLTVCRPEGYFITFMQAKVEAGEINLTRPNDMETCLRLLLDGEVDVVTEAEIVASGLISEMGIQNEVSSSEKALDISTLHVIFPKTSPSGRTMQYRFDEELAKMESDGTLNDIRRRHIQAYYSSL